MKKTKSAYPRILLCLFAATVVLVLSTFFTPFCDWYTKHIYRHYADVLGRLFAPLPVCAGEILMYLGVLLALLAFVFAVLLIFLRKKQGYRRFAKHFFKSLLMTLTCFLLLFTVTWFVPFRASVLLQGDRSGLRTEFSYYEITAILEHIVEIGDQAAEEMETGADGRAVFLSQEALQTEIGEALQNLSGEFTLLSGYYPPVKNALCSDILESMRIGGYTYPFTAESTRNKYTSPIYQCTLDSHELCHHKGYFLENEANFLSAIALLHSDELQLRMAACEQIYQSLYDPYLDAQGPLVDELVAEGKLPNMENIKLSKETKEEWIAYAIKFYEYFPQIDFSSRFWQICTDSAMVGQEIYNADEHPIDDMPALNEVIENTADVGWEVQANILQENCYDGDVLLFLQYFDGKLY